MSISGVNMCRLVTAVIVISCVSCVLAQREPEPRKREIRCALRQDIMDSRTGVMNCFSNAVDVHLNPSASIAGGCQNATDFGNKLNEYLNKVETTCNLTLPHNMSDIIKLVEFSLRKDSFKKFYDGVSCLKELEYNISNTCVKGNAGFFNITRERKHTTWYRKATLRYNSLTCKASKSVKKCVETKLKTCDNSTSAYVASLFTYVRELADCAQIESKVPTLPPPNTTSGAVPLTATWLTVGTVIMIIAGAIIIITVLIIKKKLVKCKYQCRTT